MAQDYYIFGRKFVFSGLLILNRPHGLKKEELATERGFWKKKIKLNISPSMHAVDKLSFTGALPHLQKKLKLSDLELLKAPDRYYSVCFRTMPFTTVHV